MAEKTGIILAGGRSERFSGITGTPKAVAVVAGYPLLLNVSALLTRGGVSRIIILSGDNHFEICTTLGIAASKVTHAKLEIEWIDRPASTVNLEIRQTPVELGTGGRLLTLDKADFGDAALLAYSDIITDAPLEKLFESRESHDVCMSILAVNPVMPWGELQMQDDYLTSFKEKCIDKKRWINAGIFAVSEKVLEYIHRPDEMLEQQPIERMIADRQITALRHNGIWHGIDTTKDKRIVDNGEVATKGNWRCWKKMTISSPTSA